MNLLVTGCAGFIGQHFVKQQLTQFPARTLIGVDKLTYAADPKVIGQFETNPNFTFVKTDISEERIIDQLLLEHQIQTIVHFAAESHVDNSIENPLIFFQNNLMGTVHLLNSAHRYYQRFAKSNFPFRFHHVSTDEVYGSCHDSIAWNESQAYGPRSPYSASKAASDHSVMAYYHTYGLPVTISLCSNNYGPNQHPEKFIPTIIRHALAEKPIPIYGDGLQEREWLYVSDHCDAIECILRQGKIGERYHISSQNKLTNLALCDLIVDTLQKPARIQSIPDRPGHDRNYALNTQKIRQLGWHPKIDLSTGLKRTIAAMAITNSG